MKEKKVMHKMKGILFAGLVLLFAGCLPGSDIRLRAEEAASEQATEKAKQETIDFRILATSDLHGQVTAMNYETGKEDPKAGLSKIATLVAKQRKAVGKNNTLLIDAGDFLYSYSSNYIYEKFPDKVQPIFQALTLMRYDCITLGNHDFDYPWEYIYDQIDRAGLMSKTFISNAVFTESGEYPFRLSAIYTRKMKTSEGRTVPVKIGVVGATYTGFSARRYRYSGFLDGLDVYTTVKAEAQQLKDRGADVIVAFIHGGVGLLNGANTSIQAGARIAKLDTVDAVVCSHSHETFPSNNATFAGINNVDETKGTIYGTPVVQTGSHAQALGVISLQLAVDEDKKISVISGTAKNVKVTASVKENQEIVDLFAPYQDAMLADLDPTEYRIADGLVYTNADCVVQDSSLYQLMNNAKMRYAAWYVAKYAPEYADYPLVAVSVNRLDSKEQTIELSGSLTEADVASIIGESSSERASGYVHIYKLSGENLWEWLEFNASIYGTVGTELPELLAAYAAEHPEVSSLIRPENVKDWSEFYIFDGISYEIDLSVAPRYNANGKLINYTHRITNLTYNGAPLTPNMTVLITMDSVEKRYKFMPTDEDSIFTKWLYINSHDVLMDYIKAWSEFGPLSTKADNNWRFIVPEGYQFIVAVPKTHHEYVMAQDWYQKKVKNGSLYYYYLGSIAPKTQTPNAVAAAEITELTSRAIPVRVLTQTAPDAQIVEILYLAGNVRSVSNKRWDTGGIVVNDNCFTVKKNGQYSIRVEDSNGKKVITHIQITNYNKKALEMPVVSMLTNRIDTVRGTALPGTTIHVALPNGVIVRGKTDADGNFEITVPLPRSYDLYTIWATKGSLISYPLETTVKKTGANMPSADELRDCEAVVTGKTDPYTTLALRLGSKIYVNYGETENYKKSSIYKASHTIVETEIIIREDGTFEIELQELAESGQTYLLYAIDRNGNASRALYVTVP